MKMKRTRLAGSVIAVLALSVAGCGQETPTTAASKVGSGEPLEVIVAQGLEDGVLMRVNDRPITQYDFNLWQLSTGKKDLSRDTEQELLERITNAELMYQRGVELGLDKDPAFRRSFALSVAKIKLIQLQEMEDMVSRYEADQVTIAEEEAQRYFKSNEAQIRRTYHIGSIQFASEQEAKAAVARIRKGASFETVAEETVRAIPGVDPTADLRKYWDAGFVTWHQIPPNVFSSVARLKPGKVSEPIPLAGAGYIVIKLFETGSQEQVDFASSRDEIVARLKAEAVKERLETLRKDLKKNARIEKVGSPVPVDMAAARRLH